MLIVLNCCNSYKIKAYDNLIASLSSNSYPHKANCLLAQFELERYASIIKAIAILKH